MRRRASPWGIDPARNRVVAIAHGSTLVPHQLTRLFDDCIPAAEGDRAEVQKPEAIGS